MPQITLFQRTENDSPECIEGFKVLEGKFHKYKEADVSDAVFQIIMTAPLDRAEEQMRKILSK